jgi:sialic acid synthase SpsE
MIIEFKSRSNEVVEKHLARYNQLKGWDFSGILDDNEIKEMNDEQEWLKIHNV